MIPYYLKPLKPLVNLLFPNRGVSRVVYKLGNYVIKFPRPIPHFDHKGLYFSFNRGRWSNLREYQFSIELPSSPIAHTVYCSPYGLFSICKYAKPCSDDIFNSQVEGNKYKWDWITKDLHIRNFGIIDDKLVLVDYDPLC